MAWPAAAPAAPKLTPIAGFDRPMYVTAPVGDPHRVFVVERGGFVRIVKDGTLLAEPFLDISAVTDKTRTGFASMAFAPDYGTSGLFYVLYSAPPTAGADGVDVVVDEYRVSSDPDRADAGTRREVLRLDFSGTNDHDADHIEFGPDGLLYLTVGEGASDAPLAQDTHEPRGKVLRIDPRQNGSDPYRIPPSNPFADGVGGMPELFAYGLRNPWRFSFHRERRQLLVADVGAAAREELDVLDVGRPDAANLGWPCWEGTAPHNACTAPSHQAPFFEYTHDGGRCSITGGYVVRDPSLPSLLGRYVYGDFCSGEIRSLSLDGPAPTRDDKPVGVSAPAFRLSSFGEDGCGHLYVVLHNRAGSVARLDDEPYTPCPDPPPPPAPPADDDQDGPPAGDGQAPPQSEPTAVDPPSVIGGPPAEADTTAPRLRLGGARRQRVLRNRGVVIAAWCSEPCAFEAVARIKVAGSVIAAGIAGDDGSAVPVSRRRYRLRFDAATLARLRRATRGGRRALIRVEVAARDAAGNVARAVRHVVAVR